MRKVVLLKSSIPVLLVLSAALAGCGDPAETTPSELAVAPTSADVATCRSQVFTATPAEGVTWTLEGEGTLTDGSYDAPIAVPSPAAATITASDGTASASATVTLATAFPGAAIDTGRVTSIGTPDHVHAITARGTRAYALLEADNDPDSSLALVRSDDGGLTWGAPVGLPTGDRSPSVAIDAGDDDTVYITVHGADPDAGSILDLVVSNDGGASFVVHRLFVGGNGEAADADVISGSAGHVTVTAPATWQDGNGGQGATLLVWHDGEKGAGFGALTPLDNGYDATWATGLELRLDSNRLIETNSSRSGPQLASNGSGKVCLVSNDHDINGGDDEHHSVFCSNDSGKSFGAPVVAVTGKPEDMERSRVAVSPDGELVVVAYNGFQDSSLDSIGQTRYVVSTDGGATFGAPHTHPDAVDEAGATLAVNGAEVHIDADGVIWFARTLDDAAVQIDKSCDQGTTLSGSFLLPISGSHVNASFFGSSAGLFAGAVRRGDADMGVTVVRLLAP